ncbi:MAG TPA: ATP-dependent zinc metalloprotease FtsH [Clostridiales bacterium]|nr:ATP-dependent zinc metalloprotease FtsH [Clostridiales bacterium]HQK73326.1 ATP-dependent zinc metalloprotease FtsH [Clostridiales bacterium]
MDIKKRILTILPYVLIPLLIITGGTIFSTYQKQEKTEYYQLVQYFEKGLIPEYTLKLSNGSFTYKLKGDDGKTTDKQLTVPDVEMFMKDIHPQVIEHNRTHPADLIKAKYVSGSAGTWLWNLLPTALLLVAIVLLFLFMTRRMNQTMTSETNRAMSFGKAKVKNAKDEKRKTTFDDVAGAEEEKEELMEIVEYLKAPSKFDTLGARIPKGVLLVGPPGTGKTLLGRAVAGEAGVPFLSISGADFVEMYVGVGASRVRDLFEQAKKNSPSIIFIDEIDAVGRHRGAGMGGGHDEREQTLNQLLVEMDGFGINEGVIILAATNRPDILDPALLRPGRFDRQVVVGYPDKKGREAILKVHARGKPLAPDVDLSVIAGTTVGFTGADLENLLNESALLAARRDKKAITMDEIEEATIKVLVGGEKKSRKMSDKEKKLTAYHEAGHAVATYYLEGQDPVHQVSIIPRGLAGGFTLHLPKEDKSYASMKEMLDSLVVLMGGRVSEALALDDISTGASNDIARATKTARDMVTKYGMSGKLGPVSFANESDEVFFGRDYSHIRNYSESVASEIDEEVNRIISEAYSRAGAIMNEHMDKLHKVAARLLEAEKIDGEEFLALMHDEPAPAEQKGEGGDPSALN